MYMTAYEHFWAHVEIHLPLSFVKFYQTENVFEKSCKEQYNTNNPYWATIATFNKSYTFQGKGANTPEFYAILKYINLLVFNYF
jgi:hypothetical protein